MTKQPEALLCAEALELDRDMVRRNKRAATELRRLHEVNQELLGALKDFLNRDEKNTCQHETTHRGGAIWEICDDCGSQWADVRGGKPKWKDPQEWVKARATIAKATGEQP